MGHPKDVPARDTWACNPAKASCQHEVTQELEITPNQNRNTKPYKEEELGESKKIFTYEMADVIHLSPPQFQLQEKKIHVCLCIARILEFSVKSPSVSPLSRLLSPPIPSFSGIRKFKHSSSDVVRCGYRINVIEWSINLFVSSTRVALIFSNLGENYISFFAH
jgi:hypothetical protein